MESEPVTDPNDQPEVADRRHVDEDEVDVRVLLAQLWRRRLVLVVGAIVGALVAWGIVTSRAQTYEASAQIDVGVLTGRSYTDFMSRVSKLLNDPAILTAAAASLDPKHVVDPRLVRATTSLGVAPEPNLFTIGIRLADSERVAPLAKALAERLVERVHEEDRAVSAKIRLELTDAEQYVTTSQLALLEFTRSRHQKEVNGSASAPSVEYELQRERLESSLNAAERLRDRLLDADLEARHIDSLRPLTVSPRDPAQLVGSLVSNKPLVTAVGFMVGMLFSAIAVAFYERLITSMRA